MMAESAPSVLAAWSNFYIMTGSAAASLTGLMFVVITLVSGEERVRATPDGISTFSTPTVAHFSTALLVSAILAAPWRLLIHPAILLGLLGLASIAYLIRITFLTRKMTAYVPDLEDWTWFTILPLVAYGAILAGAIGLPTTWAEAPFALAAGVVLLLFLGIRNAWDVVTFLAIKSPNKPPGSS